VSLSAALDCPEGVELLRIVYAFNATRRSAFSVARIARLPDARADRTIPGIERPARLSEQSKRLLFLRLEGIALAAETHRSCSGGKSSSALRATTGVHVMVPMRAARRLGKGK